MHTDQTCNGCHYFSSNDLEEPCYLCVRAFSGRQKDMFTPKKRIDIIGTNGNNGEHYVVEGVARILAGEGHDSPLGGKNKGKQRWELHIQQAMDVINYIENTRRDYEMSDGMSKDPICHGCIYYAQPWTDHLCSSCVDDNSGITVHRNHRTYPPKEVNGCQGVVSHHSSITHVNELAEAHWSYVRELLYTHGVEEAEVSHIGFHYVSAFIHGYKHAKEDYGDIHTTS